MINKQSMWFITLLSLVLILGVYYVTMPSDLLKTSLTSDEITKDVEVNVTSSSPLVALRASRDEKTNEEIEKLESVLTDEASSSAEKSEAYESLKLINLNISKEESKPAPITLIRSCIS